MIQIGRPAKSVRVKSGAIANGDSEVRQKVENKIRGNAAKPTPPAGISADAREVFEFIADKLVESDILGELDVFVLESTSVAIARIRKINAMIDANDGLLASTALQNSRAKYQSDLWRGCNELCLSPQARAKIGNLASQAAKESKDPLISVLGDND